MNPAGQRSPIPEANRLSTLLNISRGTERFPVDVEELARGYAQQFGHNDPIAEVIGADLPGFEGALYGTNKNGKREWALLYNSAIGTPGRIRFTMAHELGHYILHRQNGNTFECSEADLLQWESIEKRQEAEADVFASYLLMPIDDFRRSIGTDSVDLNILEGCAKRYGVSLTAAILKWLEFTEQRAVLVMSTDGYMLWARSSQSALRSGAYFRTRNATIPIPNDSLAASSISATREMQGLELAARIWFPQEPQDMSLREFKIVSDRHERTISLLILPKAEPSWMLDPEDSNSELLDEYIQSGYLPRNK